MNAITGTSATTGIAHTRARSGRAATLALALSAALLAGCAGLNTLTSEVSTYGEWPAGRAPGTFAFERLPSQQARGAETEALEAAALPALRQAGFVPAAAGAAPDVLVQVGARTSRADFQPWDDPLWWRGGFGYWRPGPWHSPAWTLSLRSEPRRFDREVAMLLRDRATGRPLFEARAVNEGSTAPGSATLTAMFQAALADFPRTGVNPRSVSVPLP
jgi:hypothetical protein